jgi:predicted regulator of amino acid metabolism with ACT domain
MHFLERAPHEQDEKVLLLVRKTVSHVVDIVGSNKDKEQIFENVLKTAKKRSVGYIQGYEVPYLIFFSQSIGLLIEYPDSSCFVERSICH